MPKITDSHSSEVPVPNEITARRTLTDFMIWRSQKSGRSTKIPQTLYQDDFQFTLPPRAIFELHLDTVLPAYVRPDKYEVRIGGDHLHIRLASAGEARALINAWKAHTVEGYKGVKMAFARADGESLRSDPNSSHNAAASRSTSRRSTANKPRRNVPKTIFWAQSPNVLRCIPSVCIFGIDDPSLDGTLAVTFCRLFFFHPKVLGSAFLEADGVCMHSAKGKTYDNLLYAGGLWGFLPGRRELLLYTCIYCSWSGPTGFQPEVQPFRLVSQFTTSPPPSGCAFWDKASATYLGQPRSYDTWRITMFCVGG
ncbi:hypothetical protein B0H19DRAFT_1346030 [Mycena capillaripes]|nr:hypothetical protein B0H19DRAFT_1346030 [Mycena capillaripes]